MPSKVWTPQPKQAFMMSRPEYEGFYGGAAGGGKSDYLLVEALRQVNVPNYNGIIFRKTYPQLSELIDRSLYLYNRAFPGAKYNGTGHVWTFPSGAKIYFGNLNRPADKINYQGKRYDFIGFDELTQFTWEEYSYLYSRNRPSGSGTRVYRRATGNPGGIGHGWVKDYFVKAAEPQTTITSTYKIIGPDDKPIELTRDRIFVPSSVFDNKALLEADPNYLASLSMMDETDKKALLYGDWDSFEGQVFMEWRDDPTHYLDRKWTHVIKPFDIPADWKIYRGFDWGYSRPFAVEWFAVDHDGRMYLIKEYYGCTGTPNTGLKITPQEVAQNIRDIEKYDENIRDKTVYGIADPAIFAQNGGESIGEMMEKCGVYFDRGDHERIAGKMQYHYRFAFDEDGKPMMYVFNNCSHFIRTIPNLIYDARKVEDIDTTQEDHIYDAVRYVLMEHPLNPRKNVLTVPDTNDPLDQRTEEIKSFYFG